MVHEHNDGLPLKMSNLFVGLTPKREDFRSNSTGSKLFEEKETGSSINFRCFFLLRGNSVGEPFDGISGSEPFRPRSDRRTRRVSRCLYRADLADERAVSDLSGPQRCAGGSRTLGCGCGHYERGTRTLQAPEKLFRMAHYHRIKPIGF